MTERLERVKRWLGDAFRGWGFTAFERQAIMLLCLLVSIASGYRIYQNRNLALRISELPAADSLSDVYSEPDPILHILINLNDATVGDLERLPGIGPIKAAKIIELRSKLGKFDSVEQLDRVEGIGPKTIDRLKPFLVIGTSDIKQDSSGTDSTGL